MYYQYTNHVTEYAFDLQIVIGYGNMVKPVFQAITHNL